MREIEVDDRIEGIVKTSRGRFAIITQKAITYSPIKNNKIKKIIEFEIIFRGTRLSCIEEIKNEHSGSTT